MSCWFPFFFFFFGNSFGLVCPGGRQRQKIGEHQKPRVKTNTMEWNGMEWKGVEWNGMEWNGMEWNVTECNGMEGIVRE